MVTLELPQARRLAASVVLGQVVITVVAAAICFAVWGRFAGLSALAGDDDHGLLRHGFIAQPAKVALQHLDRSNGHSSILVGKIRPCLISTRG